MIVLVDNEHARGYEMPWGEKIMAARVRIKYDLEDMSGHPCLIMRYSHVTPDVLRDLDAEAVFISGNSASASEYTPAAQAGLMAAIREQAWPMFGFCGGHQVMGQAHGAHLGTIGELDDGEESFGEAADFAPGMKHELGYLPIEVNGTHPLLDGLGSSPVVRQAHSWELKTVPAGFVNYASTPITPIQLIVHSELPIVGAQFHPEYATDEFPAGRQLIANFLNWSGITG